MVADDLSSFLLPPVPGAPIDDARRQQHGKAMMGGGLLMYAGLIGVGSMVGPKRDEYDDE